MLAGLFSAQILQISISKTVESVDHILLAKGFVLACEITDLLAIQEFQM